MPRGLRRPSGAAALVVAVSTLLAGCSGAADVRPGGDTERQSVEERAARTRTGPLTRFYDQRLRWRGCHGGFECSRLRVPVDYADPAAGSIRIAVVRLPAGDDEARGSLVLNPGGPGGSGVDYALAAGLVVSRAVRERYDIVGFDPRGVARSAPISCVSDAELDDLLALDGSPDDPAEEQQVLDAWRVLGAGCAADRPQLAAHLSTKAAARDLDVLRAALGDRRLTYLGKSYGTYLGTTYAELFPKRVGRLVLDGQLDPAASGAEIAAGQARGFEGALRAYLASCLRRSGCPFTGSVAAAQTQVGALLDRTDAQPLRGERGRPVTEALAVIGIAAALYDTRTWSLLTRALREAARGDGRTLLALADYYSDRRPDGRFTSNAIEAQYAVNCLDRPEATDLASYRAAATELSASAPVFGEFLAWGSVACATWPVPPQNTPHRVTAAGARPILVVGTTRDPATPYSWAVSVAKQLESGRLLTYVGDGHTAYRQGSRCIDRAVDRFLLDGKLPRTGTRCR